MKGNKKIRYKRIFSRVQKTTFDNKINSKIKGIKAGNNERYQLYLNYHIYSAKKKKVKKFKQHGKYTDIINVSFIAPNKKDLTKLIKLNLNILNDKLLMYNNRFDITASVRVIADHKKINREKKTKNNKRNRKIK